MSMTRKKGRMFALDACRGAAILGMFVTHAIPVNSASPLWVKGLETLTQLTAPLFLVIVGVSLGLLSGGSTPIPREARGRLRRQLLVRGAVLILAGLLLWALKTPIAIVLDYIGIATLIMIPLLFLSQRVLTILAAVLAVASPIIKTFVENLLVPMLLRPGGAPWYIDNPVVIKGQSWLFTGPSYWATMFLVFTLAGLLLARSDIQRPKTQWTALWAGLGLVAGGVVLGLVTGIEIHPASDTTPAVMILTGGSLAVLGGAFLLIAAGERGNPLGRAARFVTRPLAASGQLALSLYVLQVFAFFIVVKVAGYPPQQLGPASLFALALIVGSLVVAMLWTLTGREGPLEWVLAKVSGRRTAGASDPRDQTTTPSTGA